MRKSTRDAGAGDARCRAILKRICAEAGRPESSPFCREIAAHLAECEGCRAQAVSLRGTLELYRCLDRQDVPVDVARNLRKALGLTEQPSRQSAQRPPSHR